MQKDTTQQHTVRNFLALTGDFIFFSIGFAFFDPLVVVPAFAKEFTGSEFMVGILAAIRALFVTAPQLWAASILVAQPRKKPVLIASSIIGRLPIIVLAAVTLLWGASHIGWVIAVLCVAVAIFFTSEGFNGVSWPVLVGKVLPEDIRGRFFGFGQLFASLGSAAAGYFVNRILALSGQTLSARWALVFAIGFVILMISVVSMAFIKEEGEEKAERPHGCADQFEDDGPIFARGRESAPGGDRTAGAVYGGCGLAFLCDPCARDSAHGGCAVGHVSHPAEHRERGGRRCRRVPGGPGGELGGHSPGCGGQCDDVGGGDPGGRCCPFPLVFYYAAFLLVGYVNGTSWWSFSAYLLDMATDDQRPIYLAASGILTSVLVLNPVIAGALYASFSAGGCVCGGDSFWRWWGWCWRGRCGRESEV